VRDTDAVDDYLEFEMQRKNIPGMVVVILRNGAVLKEQAYGRIDLEFDVRATLEDVYPIASITTLFTAVAIFKLVQDLVAENDRRSGLYCAVRDVSRARDIRARRHHFGPIWRLSRGLSSRGPSLYAGKARAG
jgi:hypothetical protein